jgi:integrase
LASYRQRNNRWQVRVRRLGFPDQVRTFSLKHDAERWARSIESDIDRGQFTNVSVAQQTTLSDLIQRFIREVLPLKKSLIEDSFRLNALSRKPISKWSMANLSPSRIAEYRDERLKQVSHGTVIRELSYLSSIINHARREWAINIPNPVQLVRKPPTPEGRSRTLNPDERQRLIQALIPIGRDNFWLKPVVELALETAMRKGELLSLRWEHIDLVQQTAFLPTTKNGDSRTVPLSLEAIRILKELPRSIDGIVFPIKSANLHARFKRIAKRARLENFRFHDLRHTAVTNMAKKLPNIIELSAVSGHKNLGMLKRYYHPDPKQLALKLG